MQETANIALVIGVEKMTEQDTIGVTKSLMTASYQAEESDSVFSHRYLDRFADSYFQKYGNKSEILSENCSKKS